jgi:predicted porin
VQSDSAFSAFNRAAAVGLTTTRSPYTPYIKNSVRYDLPAGLDGWRGGIAIGTNQNVEAKKDHIFGFSLGYVVPGSWAVGFSHQTEQNGQNTFQLPSPPFPNALIKGNNKISINYLSGAMGTPIGKITLGIGGGKVGGVTGNDKGWNIGWSAPIDNWTLIAQYASFKASGELGNLYNTLNAFRVTPANPALRSGSARRSSFGVEARYSLSKRTTLYTGLNHTKNAAGVEGAKADIFGVGMRHDF